MGNYSFKGNIGKDPVLRFSASGTSYIFFSVAENTGKKGDPKNKTIWWKDCVAFKGVAEQIGNLRKGQTITVVKSNFEPKDKEPEKLQMIVREIGKPSDLAPAANAPPVHNILDDEIPF